MRFQESQGMSLEPAIEITPAQLEALLTPARLEIYESLQSFGEQTVADLARRLGRSPDRLYYHLGKLVDEGLVAERGTREVSRPGRNGSVYGIARKGILGMTLDADAPASRAAWIKGARTITRRAGRELVQAVERAADGESAHPRAVGPDRNLALARVKAWLGERELAELNEHLDAVAELLRRRSRPGEGELVSLTLCLAPLTPNSESPGRTTE